jgi:hypothetical protein
VDRKLGHRQASRSAIANAPRDRNGRWLRHDGWHVRYKAKKTDRSKKATIG